jgi:RHS repeat-associated protein
LTVAGSTNYSYDANGNPNQTGNSIGPNNELLSDGTWNYSYDLNGNLIGKTGVAGGADAGLTWTYSYDAANELIGATETNSQSQTLVQASYTYDVFGHRIASSIALNGGSATVTQYVYNGDTLWATQNASGALMDAYIGGDQANQFFAQYDSSNGVLWYLNGHLGSVRALMNNSGQATDSLVYDAFGNLTSQSNPSQEPLLGFQGMQFDSTVGLNYDWHRWYNPQTQQWMTQDPLLLQPGPNPHEFVNNAPTVSTDPNGEWLTVEDDAVPKWRSWLQEIGLHPFTKELPKDHWYNVSHPYGLVVSYNADPLVKYMIDEASNHRYREILRALISHGTQTAMRGNSGWGSEYVTLDDEQLHEMQQAEAQITSPQTYRRNNYVSTSFWSYAPQAFAQGGWRWLHHHRRPVNGRVYPFPACGQREADRGEWRTVCVLEDRRQGGV